MKYSAPVGLGEVSRPGPDDPELDAAARRAVASMRFFALCADIEGLPLPEPGPQYAPPDYHELAGKLECRICLRPIREHAIGEFHTR